MNWIVLGQAVGLLVVSNVFMTVAWYGHLKFLHHRSLWLVILLSWSIAFFEYCLMVPANRMGYERFSGFQLKIMQEVITLTVFAVFAIAVLRERLAWNYAVSFALILLAVYFAFGFQVPIEGARRQ
ncbi:MAG: DMT family protein [Opitutaceae bacterium]